MVEDPTRHRPGLVTRLLFLGAGTLWGLLLAGTTFVACATFFFGAAWLYVYGDSPWPEGVGRWVLFGAALAALLVLLGCLIIAEISARNLALAGPASEAKGRRTASVLIALALVTGVATTGLLSYNLDQTEQARSAAHQKAVVFNALEGMRQRFAEVQTKGPPEAETLSLRVRTSGMVGGPYRLSWRASRFASGAPLWQGEQTLDLAPGQNVKTLELNLTPLITAYRSVVLSDPEATAEVSEELALVLELVPEMTLEERRKLPASAVDTLRFGGRSLIDEVRLPLPLELRFEAGRHRWLN